MSDVDDVEGCPPVLSRPIESHSMSEPSDLASQGCQDDHRPPNVAHAPDMAHLPVQVSEATVDEGSSSLEHSREEGERRVFESLDSILP